MSGDREARALAAGELFVVNGIEYRLRPVVAQHLCDLEREALRSFKRQYLETFKDGLDLLDVKDRDGLILQKMEDVASWDLSKLPQKDAYDITGVMINPALKERLEKEFGKVFDSDGAVNAALLTALDMGLLSPKQVKEITGCTPLHGKVRYDRWWVTGTMDGMVAFIHASVRMDRPEATRSEVSHWPLQKIVEAARIVESVTSADLGNT